MGGLAGVAKILPIASSVLSIGGTLLKSKGQRSAGRAAEQQAVQTAKNEQIMAEFEARQADYLASQAKAISHREAFEERKLAAMLGSKALAAAAASGAGASDPTVVDIINNIYAEGAYRSALALYEGEEEARSFGVSAQARRLSGQSAASAVLAEGKSVRRASELSSLGTIIGGASSFFGTASQLFPSKRAR